MGGKVVQAFQLNFRFFALLLIRFAIYGATLLFADSVISQFHSKTFPRYHDLIAAPLIAPCISLVFAVILYIVSRAFPLKIFRSGIKCRDTLGRSRSIKWDELREAKLMKILGLRFVFVYMKSEIYPVAIPVFLKDMSELIDVLESLIGTEHFLTLELNKAIH